MKKYLLILLVAILLCGCVQAQNTTADLVPSSTMGTPTQTQQNEPVVPQPPPTQQGGPLLPPELPTIPTLPDTVPPIVVPTVPIVPEPELQ